MPASPDPIARWIGRSGIGRPVAARWPLIAVLIVQAILSLRLTWSNTAFQDEGLYLRAGHLEWAHWLHGTPIPDFPSYFSGAPVIYPPVAALADSIGGLAAARILAHYAVNGGFFESDTQLLDGVARLRHLPTVIIQGRYDLCCPPITAYELAERWPEADLRIVPAAGHASLEPGIRTRLLEATDRFADQLT